MLTLHKRTFHTIKQPTFDSFSVLTPGRTYIIVLSGALLWCAMILLAPVLAMLGGLPGLMGDVLYRIFHSICHQLDDRSFHVLGKPLGVCIRCVSIYVGFLSGTIVYPVVWRPAHRIVFKRAVLLWSLIPMLLDVALDTVGIHDSTIFTRIITGTMFGVVVPFFLIPVAEEAMKDFPIYSLPFLRYGSKKGSLHA